ncbi:flagellar biosynthesis sigma factor [Vibrio barjaei]|uniref:Flagellar biosynthesis sigma factor n=1 Tax=Vibrio barjaei TaxID=1676683 RepID=A0ABW7IK74_9VIBR|nr:flagellar biosynthesis sigma factor [Vibrio barjaei]MCG9786157.1 flagellar biosynthesis sigma factor [Vibrio mediterranei]MCY9872262.1 flagellar biosynthesis sigma factor [Vibrio barjaei]
MTKIIVTFIVTLALSVTGFWLYQSNTLNMETFTAWLSPKEPEPAKMQQVEIQLENVLVPINLGNRQSLLLLDVSMFTPQKNGAYVYEQLSRIKNRIIKKFSVKEASYFYNKQFIYVIQDDLKDDLDELPSLQVGDVLVTKAVFQ